MALMLERVERLARKNVLAITPYVPGKPIDEVKRELGVEDVVKLASNENCLGPSPKAVQAMADALGDSHLYPDGGCYRLKQKLASRWGMDPGHFLVGNGSDEILKLIAEAFLHEGEEVVVGWPSFSEYIFVANLMAAKVKKVPLKDYTLDLDAMAEATGPLTKLVVVCNPNNPTGTMVGAEQVHRFLEQIPQDAIVIMDEAYAEYVDDPGYPDCRQLVLEGRSIVALRTFSKIYSLAGLRVGYALAHPALIQAINRAREPFNVNSLAQAGALAALDDVEHLEASRKTVQAGKAHLYRFFDEMGLAYVPTCANFILVDTGKDAMTVFQELLKRGVIVRPASGFGLPTHIRVTVGTEEENRRFMDALRGVLG